MELQKISGRWYDANGIMKYSYYRRIDIALYQIERKANASDFILWGQVLVRDERGELTEQWTLGRNGWEQL